MITHHLQTAQKKVSSPIQTYDNSTTYWEDVIPENILTENILTENILKENIEKENRTGGKKKKR